MTTLTSIAGTAETVTVATAKTAYTALKTAFDAEVAKIEAVVQAHIGSHQAQAAAHNAEVSAAQAVLDVINPPPPTATVDPNAAKAAGFVLTATTDVSNVWAKVSKAWDSLGGWRALVITASAAMLYYGWHHGLLK